MRRAWTVVGISLSLSGCAVHGPGPAALAARGDMGAALSRYRSVAPDEDARQALARVALLRDARAEDAAAQDAALAALSGLGERAAPLLQALLARDAQVPEAVKLRALARLTELGDEAAARTLREVLPGLAGPLRAYAVIALRPAEDDPQLRPLLEDPSPEVRLAAARAYGDQPNSQPDSPVQDVLLERVRLDPDAHVRRAMLRAALARASVPTETLSDLARSEDQLLAAAALAALLERPTADREDLPNTLLRGDPSFAAIELARRLLLAGELEAEARGLLQRALTSPSPSLRAQAAVALRGLPRDLAQSLVPEGALEDPDATVRLQFGLLLLPAEAALAALRALVDSDQERLALEAAATLAARGDSAALARLHGALHSPRAASRARAGRALAGELDLPDEAVRLLADPDPRVRTTVAAALLRPARPETIHP